MYDRYYFFVLGKQTTEAKRGAPVFAKTRAAQSARVTKCSFFGLCGVLLLALTSWQAATAAITLDATVSQNQKSPTSVATSPTLSTTSVNELLLAYISADSVSSPNTTVQKVTGGGLTWVLVVRSNAQAGTSEIWRAFSPTVLRGITVSATLSQRVVSSITVQSYAGVVVSGTNGSGAIGAVASGHAAKGSPVASLVTTQNNSLLVGVGNDYDNAIARTPLVGQTLIGQYLTPTGDTYWVQRLSATSPLKGTRVTLGDSAPSGDQYNLSICEILPASSQQLSLSANSLTFGNITDGTSKALSLTLTASGASAVTVSSATVTGTGFSVGPTSLPKTLAPGQTLSLPVVFEPTTAGTVAGKITLSSNATGSPTDIVTLSGTGVSSAPQLSLSASTVAFGGVVIGSTKSLTLLLTSSGTSAVTVNSAIISGSGFSIASGGSFPLQLDPQQTLTLTLAFEPKAVGTVAGTLIFKSTSNSGSSTAVALTGTGTSLPYTVDLSWSAPATSADPVAGYHVYRATGSSAIVLVSSGLVTGTTYVDGSVADGTTYTYEIRSVDESGVESTSSNAFSITVPAS